MQYNSTQSNNTVVSSAQAIAQGISVDGGLFVPQSFPGLDNNILSSMLTMSYRDRAKYIFSCYLTDYTDDEISYCVDNAYTVEHFGDDNPCPISCVDYNGNEINILELWHGPTAAFKDMALQILPYLLSYAMKKTNDGKKAVILVATSGDTGKAALEGFKDVDGVNIIVFYPENGVSAIQKHQMRSQEGKNVFVCGIEGNFDDAQTSVKRIFTDEKVRKLLSEHNMMFSSANSINFGRLLPQVVYYISGYLDMVNSGKISLGDKINVVVPTGNFGNILAGYYAYKMGLPVNKFICASNANNVLTDFINTGVYDKNRHFYTTISPSMDILVSSNLERLIYFLSGNNDVQTKKYMDDLKSCGRYEISDDMKKEINSIFYGGFCDDIRTKDTIRNLFDKENYLCDTHTSVAVTVYDQYVKETDDRTPVLLDSTASPYKFSQAVLEAFQIENFPENEFDMIDRLNEITGKEIPGPISSIKNKTDRFNRVIKKEDMESVVLETLGI